MDIITLALAKKFAKEYTDTHASKITEEDAIQAVANYFNENPNAIVTNDELERILDNIPAGNDGKSAYEYAQEGGFTGTEEEFSQKLAADLQLDDSLKDNTKAAPAGMVGELKGDIIELEHGVDYSDILALEWLENNGMYDLSPYYSSNQPQYAIHKNVYYVNKDLIIKNPDTSKYQIAIEYCNSDGSLIRTDYSMVNLNKFVVPAGNYVRFELKDKVNNNTMNKAGLQNLLDAFFKNKNEVLRNKEEKSIYGFQYFNRDNAINNKVYGYGSITTESYSVGGNEYYILNPILLHKGKYKLYKGKDKYHCISDYFSIVLYPNGSTKRLQEIIDGNYITLDSCAELYPTFIYNNETVNSMLVDCDYIPNEYVYGNFTSIECIDKDINKIQKTIELKKEVKNTIINVGQNRAFTTIQDAINSITNPSEYNRYSILVDVGLYDITNAGIQFLPIKPYVTIKGVDKSKCIISFRPSTKDSYKNVFQQSNDFGKGYAEVYNFTLITENVKGSLHLDDTSWKGEIYFHDIIIDDISSEEVFDPSADYYHYMRASVGAINLGTHLGQKIVIENVQTNGYIYSHSLLSNLSDMDNENAGEFIVKNCVCDWIGVYGNGEAVRKKCILENNKCHFIKIAFIDNYDLGVMCWDTILVNNHADFIASQYFAYGNTSTMKSLTEEYYGRFPFADSNIHKQVQNNSGSDIPFGSKVKFTDHSHRYITVGTDSDYDAIACETINNGWYGTVQDGGNKEAYLNYLAAHELIN